MTALDRFTSLDETILAIKQTHADDIQAMKDRLLAAEIKAEMASSQLSDALRDRDSYMRVATQLIAQFSTVEKVFAEAKAMALKHQDAEAARERKAITARESEADPVPAFLTKNARGRDLLHQVNYV